MPMGPIELIDTVGLDVASGVGQELAPFLGLEIPPALATPPEPGKRGKKDGQGLYAWAEGKPKKREVPKDYKASEDLERSEEHTSELQSLMRISYAVFRLNKKKTTLVI